MIVKRTVGNDNSVVSSKVTVSATKVIIESGDSPSYTIDYPVVTDVKIIECTSLDCVVLGCGYGSTEVLTSVNRIVSTSIVEKQRSDFIFSTFNRLLFELCKRNFLQSCTIMHRNEVSVCDGRNRREVSYFLGFNRNCTHCLFLLKFSSLPQ